MAIAVAISWRNASRGRKEVKIKEVKIKKVNREVPARVTAAGRPTSPATCASATTNVRSMGTVARTLALPATARARMRVRNPKHRQRPDLAGHL